MVLQTNPAAAIATPTHTALGWEKRRTQPPVEQLIDRQLQPSDWVNLINPPTAYSFDEAWLLCQVDVDHWLAWVPDYGEILLHTTEFYLCD